MSFASGSRLERRRQVTDLRELRALAHPLRLALLDHLMSFGEQTAARCAAGVGSTTSNCSYHLRALGRAGFVERVESSDGRERPWRATATGLSYGPAESERSPAAAEAARALDELSMARDEELTRQARRRHAAQPEPWLSAEAFHDYALRVTAAELAQLTAEVDRLVRPYISMTRDAVPQDAEPARVRLLAFRDPRTPC
jgi:DNA-binding MarR family transcriptional regulator